MMHRILITILFLCLYSHTKAEKHNYGLHLISYPANVSQMSSLTLENGQPIYLEGETTLSFEMYTRQENPFGVVFRILTDSNKNIDLYYTANEHLKRYPIFVVGENIYPLAVHIIYDQWVPIQITFSRKTEKIQIIFGKEKIEIPFPATQTKHISISFGQCDFDNFKLIDIASVNIRDIKIIQNDKLIRYWKLSKHRENNCYDEIHNVPAIARNPHWLIDEYATWQKVYSCEVVWNSSFAFSPYTKKFYITQDSKEVIVFDTDRNEEQIIPVINGQVAANTPGRVVVSEKGEQLISYNIAQSNVSFFSSDTQTWSNDLKLDTDYTLNNSAIYSEKDSSIYSFGGYGFYHYNHKLTRINPWKGTFEEDTLENIPPRYASSLAIVDNTLYICGGRGSKTGKQELSPRTYFDLYAVDLNTYKVTKLWEQYNMSDEFLPAENMIYDKHNKCFYILTTQNGWQLIKFITSNKTSEIVSFPLYISDPQKQYLYLNLYYSPEQKKLYALSFQANINKEGIVDIFSLPYPPVSLNSLEQPLTQQQEDKCDFFYYLIGGIGLLSLLTGSIILYCKKKDGIRGSKEIIPVAEPSHTNFFKQHICLLGEFSVKDQNGNEISNLFSPLLKSLLILLIFHSEQSSKGIFGSKIIQILWPDKDEKAARNSRNVCLSKLKTLVEMIEGVKLIKNNGYWSIHFDRDNICDYIETMRLMKKYESQEIHENEDLNQLQMLLLRGALLPDMYSEWIAPFKKEFSTSATELLLKIYRKYQDQFNDELKLKIADTLFLHDCINEDALYIKCSILWKYGKTETVKNVYDNFCSFYKELSQHEYTYTLEELVEINHPTQ